MTEKAMNNHVDSSVGSILIWLHSPVFELVYKFPIISMSHSHEKSSHQLVISLSFQA